MGCFGALESTIDLEVTIAKATKLRGVANKLDGIKADKARNKELIRGPFSNAVSQELSDSIGDKDFWDD